MFGTLAIAFVGGVLTWSFAEYALHNWYGHLARGRNDFSREHLKHHARYLYFAATWKKVVTAAVATAVVLPVAILVAGVLAGAVYTVGFVGFYVVYEVLHRRSHTHAPIGPYGRWLRRHHFYHHFGNPKHNHGVTSPIWDIVFCTHTWNRPEPVRVPRQMAMMWLVDEAGEVKSEYRDEYVLTGHTA